MIYQNIVESEENLKVALSCGFESNIKNLLSQLLAPNSINRLGMWRNGLDDIWTHPFFKGSSRTYY